MSCTLVIVEVYAAGYCRLAGHSVKGHFASYIKVLIQADAFLAVGVQRGAALVPEEPVPMWPCMYAAVGLQPPLDTDTSEGGV